MDKQNPIERNGTQVEGMNEIRFKYRAGSQEQIREDKKLAETERLLKKKVLPWDEVLRVQQLIALWQWQREQEVMANERLPGGKDIIRDKKEVH